MRKQLFFLSPCHQISAAKKKGRQNTNFKKITNLREFIILNSKSTHRFHTLGGARFLMIEMPVIKRKVYLDDCTINYQATKAAKYEPVVQLAKGRHHQIS